MSFEVETGAMRSGAGSYGRAAADCLTAGNAAAAAGHELGMSIQDGGVSAAIATALIAVLDEVRLVGGSCRYAEAQLHQSASAYDESDAWAQHDLSGLRPGA